MWTLKTCFHKNPPNVHHFILQTYLLSWILGNANYYLANFIPRLRLLYIFSYYELKNMPAHPLHPPPSPHKTISPEVKYYRRNLPD